MGSPQPPSAAQYAELELAGRLQVLESPRRIEVTNGKTVVTFTLPRQGVSLVKVVW
jgi:xylan 1,4-beta-xylosidase